MTTNTALMVILLILMVLVGGKDGLKSFLSLLLNLGLIIAAALLMGWGANIWMVIAIFVPLKLTTIIYLGTQDTVLADQAFLSSLLVTTTVLICIILFNFLGQAFGVGDQAGEEIIGLSTAPGVNYELIAIAVALFSCLGAIAEAAVAMNEGLFELHERIPNLTSRDLLKSGLIIGEDIIGTTANTILFGFFGSFLALFIWYIRLHYSFTDIVNDKFFVQEFLVMLYSLVGILLIIPLTILVFDWRLKHTQKSSH